MIRAQIDVSGVVQGVGFRYEARSLARQHMLKGSVQNMKDGTVRIICEGGKADIERMIESIHDIKWPIEVDGIQTKYSEPTGEDKNFKIITGDIIDELVEGHGTGALYLKNITEKQDKMLDKQDKMLDKQDKTIDEIHTLSSNIHNMMDSRFHRLEEEIAKIKTKLSI